MHMHRCDREMASHNKSVSTPRNARNLLNLNCHWCSDRMLPDLPGRARFRADCVKGRKPRVARNRCDRFGVNVGGGIPLSTVEQVQPLGLVWFELVATHFATTY